jgi:putative PIN family toxin of toxin-antitoxin system
MSKVRSPIQVVLDTNVLASALRSRHGASHTLLTLLGDGGWEINLSPALVLEYEEVAKRPAQQLWANPSKVEEILDYLCAESNKPRIFYTWRPTLPDADDDLVLEVAVAGDVDFIVTHNVSDFKAAKQFGIGILTPKAFLALLKERT